MVVKKKSKKKSSDSYDPYMEFVNESDDDAFEPQKKELEKYSLKYKLQHFLKIHSKKEVPDEDDDHSSYQKSLMGSASDSDSESVKIKKDKNLLFKLRWYEWFAIVIEILLVLYLILVLFRVLPIF